MKRYLATDLYIHTVCFVYTYVFHLFYVYVVQLIPGSGEMQCVAGGKEVIFSANLDKHSLLLRGTQDP